MARLKSVAFWAIPLAALLAIIPCLSTKAADLSVVVTGLRSGNGDVHIAIYDRADAFPESEGMVSEVKVPIQDRHARFVFKNLPPAFYAVAVYHDENANHDFDTGVLGIPLEGYAFSSGARVFLGPPSFEDAKFALPAEGAETVIPITY
jgi:uncharacterized protein (DUF2141 family)